MALLDQRTLEQKTDPSLQLAPKSGKGPNLGGLKRAFETTVRDCFTYVSQCRQNYETRYAIWNGQASDGKKHSREGDNIEPTPWDGASDLRVYLADMAINMKVAMKCMARKKANLVAVPINGNDLERAKIVSTFLRWLVNTQIPEIDRETELLAQFLEEKGAAVTGQFWEETQERTLDTLNLDDFQQYLPPGLDIRQVIQHRELVGTFVSVLMEHYDISKKKARSMLDELVQDGKTSIPVIGKKRSYPILRAFNLDEDIFIPPYATDLEMAPYIFRVQYYTAEKMRSFVHSAGWDRDWVEAAIKKCKGKIITLVPDKSLEPIARNYIFRYQRFNDLIGVVYAYQRLSDEDGVPGIYLTVFNPDLPATKEQDGFAKHELLGYRHGQYPFVLHRREYLSRRIHDSRGIPEAGKASQDLVKSLSDARIDAASIGILPPIMYPAGRPPGKWGPGSRIPERRAGEYHFADRPSPMGDINLENAEKVTIDRWNQYVGNRTQDSDPATVAMINQFETDRFLTSMSMAYRQIWKLYQQYGDEKVFFRVIGMQKATPQEFRKGDPTEDFDIYLTFDALQFDREAITQKIQNIIQTCMAADKFGQTDWSQVLQIALDDIDPTVAERVILPKENATMQTVEQVQNDLSQISGGIDKDIKLGTPPQLAAQIMQQWTQQPDVAARLQQDQSFAQRVQKYGKQIQFAAIQQQNAKIGKFGA